MNRFLAALRQRILVCDGGMGSTVLAQGLCKSTDCIDTLTFTHPEAIRSIHESFLRAGSDVIQTNTFNAAPHTLQHFAGDQQTFELNRRAAELAREAMDQVPSAEARFVLGSVGPGREWLNHQAWEDSYTLQCDGLLAGGVDGILIETCSQPAQIEAAVKGARGALAKAGRHLPVLVQMTPDHYAAIDKAAELQVDVLGLNCGAGMETMLEAAKYLRKIWPGLISLQPSAGLPILDRLPDDDMIDRHAARYPLSPTQMAQQMERSVSEYGVNLVGGCCGTTPEHIQALCVMAQHVRFKQSPRDFLRPDRV